MFGWLFQRPMTGGVVFGPAAWKPVRIENTFGEGGVFVDEEGDGPRVRELPAERREAAAFLEEIAISRTSGVIPGLPEQLRGLGEAKVRALVLNLLPTQPEFALGAAMTRLSHADVLSGLDALRILLKPARTLIVADRHDAQTLAPWRRVARSRQLEVRGLLNKYPQGHPVILVRALFGKRLPVDVLPSRGGRVIVDAVTCWGIGRWIRTGAGLSERPIQLFVEGEGIDRGGAARLVMGRIGETIETFCARYGVTVADKQVIVNGMMSGKQVDARSGPDGGNMIDSATESVAVRTPALREPPNACLACGWCVDVCPTALVPVRLMELSQRLPSAVDLAKATTLAGQSVITQLRGREAKESLHCISCGLCSYVCPTRLPLMEETVALRIRVAAATGRIDKSAPGVDR